MSEPQHLVARSLIIVDESNVPRISLEAGGASGIARITLVGDRSQVGIGVNERDIAYAEMHGGDGRHVMTFTAQPDGSVAILLTDKAGRVARIAQNEQGRYTLHESERT